MYNSNLIYLLLLLVTAPCVCKQHDLISFLGDQHRSLKSSGNIGLSKRPLSEACARLMTDVEKMLIDEKQLREGIVGGILVKNDCKILMESNILTFKTQEAQDLLCANPCYKSIADKYNNMLDLNCFNGVSELENSSGKLNAGAYRLACQQNVKKEYCVTIMGDVVNSAGKNYDICSDVVSKWGCCFQNYKMYYSKLGTNATANALEKVAAECSGASNTLCTCADNGHAGEKGNKYRMCSGFRRQISLTVIIISLILLFVPSACQD